MKKKKSEKNATSRQRVLYYSLLDKSVPFEIISNQNCRRTLSMYHRQKGTCRRDELKSSRDNCPNPATTMHLSSPVRVLRQPRVAGAVWPSASRTRKRKAVVYADRAATSKTILRSISYLAIYIDGRYRNTK